MEEEFDEADILFPEEETDDEEFMDSDMDESNQHEMEPNEIRVRSSSPISISSGVPVDVVGFRRSNAPASVISSRIFVPPHIILDRRERRKMAFLVQPETQFSTNQRMYATNQRMANGRRRPPSHFPMI
jgi:hypothetical protein